MRILISHKHKYIYIPIHKCATTSVIDYLSRHEDYKNMNPKDIVREMTFRGDDIIKYSDYFTFAIVRNPYARFLSAFFSKRTNALKGIKYPGNKNKFISFSKFVDVSSKYKKPHLLNKHIRPQHYFLEQVDKIDYICRLESINEGLKKIQQTIGFKTKGKLKKMNSTRHKHYSYYYSKTTMEQIKKLYKKDLEILNYEFERK